MVILRLIFLIGLIRDQQAFPKDYHHPSVMVVDDILIPVFVFHHQVLLYAINGIFLVVCFLLVWHEIAET